MRKKFILLISFLAILVNGICQYKPSQEEFFRVCDSLGVHHKEVVWAQARLESGNFTSDHYKNRNNCLGIYDSKNKRYASFNNWKECLLAYKTRFQYKCKNLECTNEEYLRWLTNAGYAKDSTYYDHVYKILVQGK